MVGLERIQDGWRGRGRVYSGLDRTGRCCLPDGEGGFLQAKRGEVREAGQGRAGLELDWTGLD